LKIINEYRYYEKLHDNNRVIHFFKFSKAVLLRAIRVRG